MNHLGALAACYLLTIDSKRLLFVYYNTFVFNVHNLEIICKHIRDINIIHYNALCLKNELLCCKSPSSVSCTKILKILKINVTRNDKRCGRVFPNARPTSYHLQVKSVAK